MNDWAYRRKVLYLSSFFTILGLVVFFLFWNFWYEEPNCFDGYKNGDETGIDCGGKCTLVCNADTLPPIIKWDPRIFEIVPGVWNMLVYIENPNIDTTAVYAPYNITIYDNTNKILYQKNGATSLPKNRTVGVFDGPINLGAKPAKVLFQFEKNIVWRKSEDNLKNLKIEHSPILSLDITPKIEATLENRSLNEIKFIELVVAVFDGKDNVIATSRTFVDRLKKNEKKQLFFTWPNPFKLGERACTKQSDIVLLLDRSGSMASVSKNPPQPLTEAKEAAKSFVDRLKIGDKIGVVAFANDSNDDIPNTISDNFDEAKNIIDSVKISSAGTQYTNIYDALITSEGILSGEDLGSSINKVVVLLTDGLATYPIDPNAKTEQESIAYAEKMALNQSNLMKKDGFSIYTIGLGSSVNQNFLKSLASGQSQFFFAPKSDDLFSVYESISSDICKEAPARIEITAKILDV